MSRLKIILNSIFKRYKNIRNNTKISLISLYDDRCKLSKNIFVDALCILHSTEIGEYSYVGRNCNLSHCKIGRFCSISSDVKIGLAKHPTDYITSSPLFYSKNNVLNICFSEEKTHYFNEYDEVIIENDVWIGANVIIKGGVKIGSGAIIGAGSIVTKDVDPYTIVFGNPAKLYKKRFHDDVIEKLLQLRWWEFKEDKYKYVALYLSDIDKFINIFYDEKGIN